MNLVEKIKKFFTRKQIENKTQKIDDFKTLETINVYDDVIIVINDIFYNGWISGKTKTHLLVVYDAPNHPLNEVIVPYSRPLNRSIIVFNNITLYLNRYEYK